MTNFDKVPISDIHIGNKMWSRSKLEEIIKWHEKDMVVSQENCCFINLPRRTPLLHLKKENKK